MEENKVEQNQNGSIRQVLHALKRNIGLILVIVILATGCGFGYSYLRDPQYTAKVRVSFSVEGKDSTTIGENMQYIDTMVDFVDEGVVVDRANAYYIKWVDQYKANGENIQDFYNTFKNIKISGQTNELFDKYDRETTLKADRFIFANFISTQTKKNQNDTNWIFQIGYTDGVSQDALEKAYILVLAYEHELEGGDYFVGESTSLSVNISNLGYDGESVDLSKKKIVAMAFLIGFVIALLIVYLKTLFDKTIKNRDELALLTETEILGCIEMVEEVKNGK